MTLDLTDKRLLACLQDDAQMTADKLGEQLHLSPSQISRRRQRLEREGYIDGYAARVRPEKVGLAVQAFIQVEMAVHDPDAAREFVRDLEQNRQISSVWTLTGNADYLLRVYCTDLAALNRLIHEDLLPHQAVARVHSQIVMAQPKRDTPLGI